MHALVGQHAYDVSSVLSNYHYMRLLANQSVHLDSGFITANSTSGMSDPRVVSYAISLLDVFNTLIFIVFLNWVQAAVDRVSRRANVRFVTAADYAVFVEGLPPDATKQQVLDHFDALYQLERPDWTWPGLFWEDAIRSACGRRSSVAAGRPTPSRTRRR